MGDFNDDPGDQSIRYNANSTRERGDAERAQTAQLFNIAWGYARTQPAIDHRGHARTVDGTLYHRGEGNVFDQVLVNRSLITGEGGLAAREDLARSELHPGRPPASRQYREPCGQWRESQLTTA
jgi:hypothetical protein